MATAITSAAHTSGPWTYASRERVVSDSQQQLGVAFVIDAGNSNEALANGSLIAAAPELLDACQYALIFVRAWEEIYNVKDPTITRRTLEQAIANAHSTE